MIKANFFLDGEFLCGFQVSGHSGAGTAGNDIICASVSSAAYMTANTITDVIMLNADISVQDGYMELVLNENLPEAQQILEGLRLHLTSLADEYPNKIKVTSIRRCKDA